MTFTLAHLSDLHVGPLPHPHWRELMGKRLTGYWNWHRHRHDIHDMDALDAIIRDIVEQTPDHIALVGDLVNIGLAAEYPLAAGKVAALGAARDVSIVPGNHDVYVRHSLVAMRDALGNHMRGDDGSDSFPYLRIRGEVALVGICSGIPTLPLLADGRVGHAQLARLDEILAHARKACRTTVVMIHHPPHRGGSRLFRGLRDAIALETVLARHGADLVLHGHNHKRSLTHLRGPGGAQIPVVGVASASAVPGDPLHRAAWHLYRIDTSGNRPSIEMEVRGIDGPDDVVRTMDHVTIV